MYACESGREKMTHCFRGHSQNKAELTEFQCVCAHTIFSCLSSFYCYLSLLVFLLSQKMKVSSFSNQEILFFTLLLSLASLDFFGLSSLACAYIEVELREMK